MIANDNELLGLLISNMNKNNECSHDKAMDISGLDDYSYLYYCKILQSKGFVQMDNECIYLTSIGISNYVPKSKKVANSVLKSSKFALKGAFKFLFGIISGIIIAFVVYHFGWQ